MCQKGFERESEFHKLLGEAREKNPTLKASELKATIAKTDPEFLKGLFAPRPHVRKLRYIGCSCDTQPCPHGEDDFFEVGKVYQSIDFTGATYSFEGAENRRIGAAYFEEVQV